MHMPLQLLHDVPRRFIYSQGCQPTWTGQNGYRNKSRIY